MKSRSQARRAVVPDEQSVDPKTVRNSDGDINNCSVANGEPEEGCQICKGDCPDRKRFYSDPMLTQNAAQRPAWKMLEHGALKSPKGPSHLERTIAALTSGAIEASSSLDAGDVVHAEMGPVTIGPMTVGRVAVSTRVRPKETAADAYLRARRAATLMFDAETARCFEEHAVRVGPQGVAKLLGDIVK